MAANYTEIAQLLVKANAGEAGPDPSRPPFGKVEAMLGHKLTKTSHAMFRAAYEAACDHWFNSHSPRKPKAPKKVSLGRPRPLQAQRAVAKDTALELETLRALERASRRMDLSLRNLYLNQPGVVQKLVSKGYWYVASATQGNITHDGVAALQR